MGPYYQYVCKETGRPIDPVLVDELKVKNEKILADIDAEILDAEQNLGWLDCFFLFAWLKKSEYLCQIGDKDAAVSAFRNTYEKTVGMGYRIDLVFNLIRLGLFFLDHKLINANISKAKDLMEQVCALFMINTGWAKNRIFAIFQANVCRKKKFNF
jgi:26S proteasome regulatory subunit N7